VIKSLHCVQLAKLRWRPGRFEQYLYRWLLLLFIIIIIYWKCQMAAQSHKCRHKTSKRYT